jgi:hypothetical protein
LTVKSHESLGSYLKQLLAEAEQEMKQLCGSSSEGEQLTLDETPICNNNNNNNHHEHNNVDIYS